MTGRLRIAPLTAGAFAPFGDVLEIAGPPDRLINDGMCGRHHDRARLDFGDGRAGISLFDARARTLPYRFDLLERHPGGSQAFLPMHGADWLIIAAPDEGGRPGPPRAFRATGAQGVNLHRGTWHGVCTPLDTPGLFAVVDRIGNGANLEEHRHPRRLGSRRINRRRPGSRSAILGPDRRIFRGARLDSPDRSASPRAETGSGVLPAPRIPTCQPCRLQVGSRWPGLRRSRTSRALETSVGTVRREGGAARRGLRVPGRSVEDCVERARPRSRRAGCRCRSTGGSHGRYAF